MTCSLWCVCLDVYYHYGSYHCRNHHYSNNGLLTGLGAPAFRWSFKTQVRACHPSQNSPQNKSGPLFSRGVLSHNPLFRNSLPTTWPGSAFAILSLLHGMCFPRTGLPDLANNLQCLRQAYTKKLFTVYLKFKFTWASLSFLSVTPWLPVNFFGSLLKCHFLGEAFSGLTMTTSSSPVLLQYLLHFSHLFLYLAFITIHQSTYFTYLSVFCFLHSM